jgi:WD40 repeat protein
MWTYKSSKIYFAQPDAIETGHLKVNSHQKPITAATFAPDGTALATASEDGEVKFFQVYLQDRLEPRFV